VLLSPVAREVTFVISSIAKLEGAIFAGLAVAQENVTGPAGIVVPTSTTLARVELKLVNEGT
jgi:hypothetical protein